MSTVHFFALYRVMEVGAKGWWGPRVWNVLHSLAEISNRTDCGPAWRNVLLTTADMIPCDLCRAHFREHVGRMSFPVGATMYPWLRDRLWAIHRDTGGSLPQEELAAVYGGTRTSVVERVLPIIEEVVRGLQGSPAMNSTRRAALGSWNRATHALIAIVRNDQQAPDNRRRR